jgi:hypothetical protein
MNSVDRVANEVDEAMTALKGALRGIPARREGFLNDHKALARSLATLHTELRYARLRAADAA